MLNFVTQCRSPTTLVYGRAVNSSWFQRCFPPSAVAPKTRNSQRSGRNLGDWSVVRDRPAALEPLSRWEIGLCRHP
ncbi:hypothetical protein SFUMM280S_07648 [Streptomyces fumanus]